MAMAETSLLDDFRDEKLHFGINHAPANRVLYDKELLQILVGTNSEGVEQC